MIVQLEDEGASSPELIAQTGIKETYPNKPVQALHG